MILRHDVMSTGFRSTNIRTVFQMLKQDIGDQKPILDKLNKSGIGLAQLVSEDDAFGVSETIASDNDRFSAIRDFVRERSNTLDDALTQSVEVSYQLAQSVKVSYQLTQSVEVSFQLTQSVEVITRC